MCCIQQLTHYVLCCLLNNLHWLNALSNTMHVEIQHWEISPALDWNIYHSGFCTNCHSPKESQEQPKRCHWEVTLGIDVTKKHFKRLQHSLWNKTGCMIQPHCQYFDYYTPLLKKQAYPFIPSSDLTAWNMEKQLHKKPKMFATKSGHLDKKYI